MQKAIAKFFGQVVRGQGRGATLGFPTANIAYDVKAPIEYGVYACFAVVREERHMAAVSVGVNEMFEEKSPTVEVHLLDFSGDIYGENVEIEFVKKIRDMIRFSTVEELKKQIKNDIEEVRMVLSRNSIVIQS